MGDGPNPREAGPSLLACLNRRLDVTAALAGVYGRELRELLVVHGSLGQRTSLTRSCAHARTLRCLCPAVVTHAPALRKVYLQHSQNHGSSRCVIPPLVRGVLVELLLRQGVEEPELGAVAPRRGVAGDTQGPRKRLKSRIDASELRRIETVLRMPQVVANKVDTIYPLKAVKDDHGIPVVAARPIKPALLSASDLRVHRIRNARSKSHGLGNVTDVKFSLGPLFPRSSLRLPRVVATDDVRANASRQNEQEKAAPRPQKDLLEERHSKLRRYVPKNMPDRWRGNA